MAQETVASVRPDGADGVDASGGNAALSGNVELPVQLIDDDKSQQLRLEVRSAVLARYPQSAFFTFSALVHNEKPAQLETMDWRLDLVDDAGAVVATASFTAPPNFGPSLRQGDALPLHRLLPTKPTATAAQLRVLRRVEEPVTTWPEAPVVELFWDAPAPAGVSFVLRERRRELRPVAFGAGPYAAGAYAFENTGSVPVKLLRVAVRAFDASGELLPRAPSPLPSDGSFYVTSSSAPTVRPGEVRVAAFTLAVPAATARVELWVVECGT